MSDVHMRAMDFPGRDEAFARRLTEQAAWNQCEADWRRFLDPGIGAGLVAECGGIPAATGVVVFHPPLAWIAMILVDEHFRRRGIGRAMVAACIDRARQGGARIVGLDATPAGRPLYETLGFQGETRLARWEGRGGGGMPDGVLSPSERDLAEVEAFDAVRFGADRSRLLARLVRDEPGRVFMVRDGARRVRGYAVARRGARAFQVGPWVADTPEAAGLLLDATLAACGSEPVLMDLSDAHPAAELASARGFRVQRPFVRMYLGDARPVGRPGQVYSIGGADLG